jgi:hypothetical protein
MPWAVKFRGKDFILDDNWEPKNVKELVADTLNLELLEGSFGFTFHDNGINVVDITFEESHAKDLPFNGAQGVHEIEPFPFGKVYFFTGFPHDNREEIIVLYENQRELCPPENDVRFPLKDHSNENQGSESQGKLF